MTVLHVIGAGGHGRVVFDVVESLDCGWRIVWYDDAWETMDKKEPVSDVLPVGKLWAADNSLTAFVAIGRADIRLQLIEKLLGKGHRVLSPVHSRAVVSPRARMGDGSVLMAGAVVQTGTTLGIGVIVNTAATVDHDCSLEDGVHIAPGAHLAGDVSVGAASWIGAGAVIREGINVGSGVTIGAGAVVVADVADGLVMVGNPARKLERRHS